MTDNPPAKPRIVLDTNVLIQSIPTKSRFRPIIEALDAGRLLLIVSNEILLEYEEILKAIGGPAAWTAFKALLKIRNAFVKHVDPTYYWKAIQTDRDDNKFVDAAVAGEADWIVTEDSHFSSLYENTQIAIRPLHPLAFIERYL